MRALLLLAVCSGCGRLAFDAADDALAPRDSYSAAVLADRPAAYWRLADASGTVARDEMEAHHGTYSGGCELGVTGALSSPDPAVRFDGTCRIMIGDAFGFAGGATYTIELWANPSVVSSLVRWLVGRDTPSGPHAGYQMAFQDVELWFETLVDVSSGSYIGAGAPPATGRFQHVVVTTDGAMQRLYVDGVEVNKRVASIPIPAAAGTLVLGGNARVGNPFSGVIDEVAFYDRALDPARVTAHFAAR